jgi:hypothetical protein
VQIDHVGIVVQRVRFCRNAKSFEVSRIHREAGRRGEPRGFVGFETGDIDSSSEVAVRILLVSNPKILASRTSSPLHLPVKNLGA